VAIGLLELVERGDPAFVPNGTSSAFLEHPLSARALAGGILGARRTTAGTLLEPRNWVGTLRVPGRTVRVSPRYPVWFREARALAASYAGKPLREKGPPEAAEDEAQADTSLAFVAALEAAVADGLPFEYAQSKETSGRPRGRILFSESVRRLWSVGIRHRVVHSAQVKDQDQDVTSAVATAGRLVAVARELPPKWLHLMERLLEVRISADRERADRRIVNSRIGSS
jgi:hypothetical protein